MQFYILTYTYLLFSNEIRPALVASLSLPLFSHIGICSVSFDFQTKKREYKSEKKCTQDEDAAIKTHIYTKYKKKKMTVIFKKKEEKKKLALYSLVL
jgi:hypothetical protein